MGLFNRAKGHLGIEDKALLANGTLALGNVVKVEPTHLGVGSQNSTYGMSTVCNVTVEVIGLDGQDPYQASCLHAIPQVYLPQLQQPGASVAVRVDPADLQHIELDLAHDVPDAPIIAVSDDGTEQTITTNKSVFTVAEILRDGEACTVDVLLVFPLNQKSQDGRDVTGLVLNVHRTGTPVYQAQIGTPIPEGAVAKVIVGATLPAKWVPGPGLPTDVNLVAPDWPAILA